MFIWNKIVSVHESQGEGANICVNLFKKQNKKDILTSLVLNFQNKFQKRYFFKYRGDEIHGDNCSPVPPIGALGEAWDYLTYLQF